MPSIRCVGVSGEIICSTLVDDEAFAEHNKEYLMQSADRAIATSAAIPPSASHIE
jgi:hypothetical protein